MLCDTNNKQKKPEVAKLVIINIYILNNKAPKYMKQQLT